MAFSRPLLVVTLGALFASGLCQSRADDPPKLPESVTPMTKELLATKVPNFFCFDYPFESHPGRRLWMRVDDRHFVERYPDGSDSRFKIVGHTTVRKMTGTIVAKLAGDPATTGTPNDESFQVFIPDKDGEELAILFREDPKAEWRDMSWSQNRKTIIVKVE
jgi:hypothetical protein